MAELLSVKESLDAEPIALAQASRRVLAEDARALVDLPPFPSSAMDGFAVRSADTPGRLQIAARIAAGSPAAHELRPGEAMAIATGGVVPSGADAVVPVEYVVERDNEVEVAAKVAEGASIRPRGGDVRAGGIVVQKGTR